MGPPQPRSVATTTMSCAVTERLSPIPGAFTGPSARASTEEPSSRSADHTAGHPSSRSRIHRRFPGPRQREPPGGSVAPEAAHADYPQVGLGPDLQAHGDRSGEGLPRAPRATPSILPATRTAATRRGRARSRSGRRRPRSPAAAPAPFQLPDDWEPVRRGDGPAAGEELEPVDARRIPNHAHEAPRRRPRLLAGQDRHPLGRRRGLRPRWCHRQEQGEKNRHSLRRRLIDLRTSGRSAGQASLPAAAGRPRSGARR